MSIDLIQKLRELQGVIARGGITRLPDSETLREAAEFWQSQHGMPSGAVFAIAKAIEIIERLTAERDRLKVDAERYRWLRKRLYKDEGDLCAAAPQAYDDFSGPLDERFDASIDAAIQAAAMEKKA